MMVFEGLMNQFNIRNGIHYIGVNANSELLIMDFIIQYIFIELDLSGENTFILFDNDKKGIETAQQYELMYFCNNITHLQNGYDGKDIADIVKNSSEDEICNFAEQLIKVIWP